jgi:formylglycine-generating enzyme required for sulfatase activity
MPTVFFPWIVTLAASLPAETPTTRAEDREAILKRFVSEFVLITPGKGKFPARFTMGSSDAKAAATEKPAHEVFFGYSFSMARYEVTQELYLAIMGENPAEWKGPRNSVEMVDWNEAVAFCQKVTQQLRKRKLIAQDEVVRLPSEAEWEYCCRAGTATPYSFPDVKDIDDYCWWAKNSPGNDPPVGKKKPNPWGLYDMHGYVWEWCADTAHPSYEGAPKDGSAWVEGKSSRKVIRGGAFNSPAESCRSAARAFKNARVRGDDIGFRCVLAREEKKLRGK